ncbi:MAG: DEAD/DEAH box helicase [Spirochaetaceae bacterium]|jgi:superfamily II DNA/RNA helicase|nr:DEAD/DEAH box helicase [Spirochaetaceae bacterium]
MKNTVNDNSAPPRSAAPDTAPDTAGITGPFAELGVDPSFIQKLAARAIFKPTAIQKQVIPLLAAGESCLFRSATGTGKTFAYLLPLLRRLLAEYASPEGACAPAGPRMLICAPTYELCSQIKGEADFLLAPSPASGPPAGPVPAVSLIIGSAAMGRQIETLKKDKPAVVVGTPGRLLALARMGKLKLRGLTFLVLDEGDRLTAEELREETTELLTFLPRGGCLWVSCSATLPPQSRERLLGLFGETAAPGAPPRIVETDDAQILRDQIEHWAFFCEERRKIQTLRSLLAAVKPKKALVFSGRSGQPKNIVSQLRYHHLYAAGLYGDQDKKSRKEAIDGFRSGKITVLVSSDLAARGLDIPGITHVIALDVPDEPGPYIHRAGRTGRAGKRGIMITLGGEEELRRLARLEKKLGIAVYPQVLYRGQVCPPEPLENEGLNR